MTFSDALDYLYSLGHETLAMKFGLENTEKLLAAFSNPQNEFLKIQIAGTNGKGSTAAFLDSICCAAGVKTGLYTSPHLISITERIKIAGRDVSKEKFAESTALVRETAQDLVRDKQLEALPTFFEQVTAIGLLAFRDEKVDLAILETGLGGRLDSTTAANAEIAGLTPIDFDHQEYLGDTLELIAGEKAAIIRPGARAITSKQKSAAAQVISERCRQVGVELIGGNCRAEVETVTADGKIIATFHTENGVYPSARLNLRGRHQLENAGLAIGLAEILQDFGFKISRDAVILGLETARHAGRLDFWSDHQTPILFDGAHNAAGARSLREYLLEFHGRTKITVVFGAMRDKDLREISDWLFPLAANLILTPADNPRSAQPADLQKFAAEKVTANQIHLARSVAEALKIAQEITEPNDLICVTGSLYLIGEAQKVLGETGA